MFKQISLALSTIVTIIAGAMAIVLAAYISGSASPRSLRLTDQVTLTKASTLVVEAHRELAFSEAAVVAFEADVGKFHMTLECPVEASRGAKYSAQYAAGLNEAGMDRRYTCSEVSDAAKLLASDWRIRAKSDANKVKNVTEDLATATQNHAVIEAKAASLEKAGRALFITMFIGGLAVLCLIVALVLSRKKN
jgi:spore coat protein U-like protein